MLNGEYKTPQKSLLKNIELQTNNIFAHLSPSPHKLSDKPLTNYEEDDKILKNNSENSIHNFRKTTTKELEGKVDLTSA